VRKTLRQVEAKAAARQGPMGVSGKRIAPCTVAARAWRAAERKVRRSVRGPDDAGRSKCGWSDALPSIKALRMGLSQVIAQSALP
jgi:hypothetical protein